MTRQRLIFACVFGASAAACSLGDLPGQRSRPDGVETAATAPALSSTEHHIDEAAKNHVIRELASKLEATYLSSSVAAELEGALLLRLESGAYAPITDVRELARALTKDLREVVADKHLGVNYVPLTTEPIRQESSGIRKVEVLPGNIGYLQLESFPPLERSKAAISGAFAMLAGTDALIIDNRNNHGGDPGTVAYYVSYLSDGPPFVVSRLRFRDDRRVDELRSTDLSERSYGTERPVFVLDSASTFSGGEALGYALQARGRAKIVGEVTGGGAHPSLTVSLGHGLVGSIPFARAENPITGSNWEGVGVIPDVAVPAERALSAAERLARDAMARRERLPSALASAGSTLRHARAEDPRPSRAPNQVHNGDFSQGREAWGITTWSGPLADGEHAHRLDEGKLCFTVKPSDRILVGWPPEAGSHAIAVERGMRYQLSFKASASGSLPISVQVKVGHRLPPYTPITSASVDLDSSFKTFTIDVQPDDSDDEVGLAFMLAALGGEGVSEVCLDDVELKAL